jgi:hypothetical protein
MKNLMNHHPMLMHPLHPKNVEKNLVLVKNSKNIYTDQKEDYWFFL